MSRTKAELAAIDRDGGVCRRCSKNLWEQQASLHHRQPRGSGGGDPKRYDRCSNLVTLCGTGTTGCHGWVERNRKAAYDSGWLVSRYRNPSEVPLITLDHRTVMLLDDGTDQIDTPYTGYFPEAS